jgi:hypothetical protein
LVTAASQYSDTASRIENLCIIEKLGSEGKEKQSREWDTHRERERERERERA